MMKMKTGWLTLLVLLCLGAFLATPALAENPLQNDTVYESVDNHCGSGASPMASGGCAIPGMQQGMQQGMSPGRLVPRAPMFGGQQVVPEPEPQNTAAPLTDADEFRQPETERPQLYFASQKTPPEQQRQSPQPRQAPQAKATPLTSFVPTTVWAPVTVMRPVQVQQAPTSGYRYSERRTGLLGLRGKVIEMQQYGSSNYTYRMDE